MTGIAPMAARGSGARRASWSRSRNGQTRIAEGQHGKIKTRELDWGDYELVLTETDSGAEASMGFWSGYGGQAQR